VLREVAVGDQVLVVRRLSIPPGGSTGWHHHDRSAWGVVRQGTLTHFAADCVVDGVYGPRSIIRERGGPDNVHLGMNLGDSDVIMLTFQVVRTGDQLAVDDPVPACWSR
jgi:hypothetical protein